MPVYIDPSDDPAFARVERRHRWFPQVLRAEYGEIEPRGDEEEIPAALNWLALVPAARRYDFEDVECSLVYVDEKGGYAGSVWDVSGENDAPWAVFVVDDYGARLLPEYSALDDDASEADLEDALRRAAHELPDRIIRGEFTRAGTPVSVPDWLMRAADKE